MQQEKAGRGGWRPNSGRPTLGGAPRVHGSFMLDADMAQMIATRAARETVSRSEALARCLREWAASTSSDEQVTL